MGEEKFCVVILLIHISHGLLNLKKATKGILGYSYQDVWGGGVQLSGLQDPHTVTVPVSGKTSLKSPLLLCPGTQVRETPKFFGFPPAGLHLL